MTDTPQPAWWLVDDEGFVIAGPYDCEAAADEGNQDVHPGRLTTGYGHRDANGFLDPGAPPGEQELF